MFCIWAANIIFFGIVAAKMTFFYTKIQFLQELCQEKMPSLVKQKGFILNFTPSKELEI